MKVLTAIPVFNEARHLDGVLHEVRRYCSNILIVDDGSTDGTAELLAKQPDITVIEFFGIGMRRDGFSVDGSEFRIHRADKGDFGIRPLRTGNGIQHRRRAGDARSHSKRNNQDAKRNESTHLRNLHKRPLARAENGAGWIRRYLL